MNRDELVEMVRELIAEAAGCGDENCANCTRTARAVLAIIEPAVREDERGRCAALVKGWVPWRFDINPPLAAAIRAGDKP